MRYIWIFFGFLLLLVTLLYTWRLRYNTIDAAIKEAARKSDYKFAEMNVYDGGSSERYCNRLISVEPFHWLLWCYGDQTFILHEEGVSKCATNNCSALLLKSDGTMIEKCLGVSRDTLESFYMSSDIVPVSIPYTVSRKSKTFTILDTLNILLDYKLLYYPLRS